MPKTYPEELRKQITACVENGESIDSLCLKHQISRSTLYRWIKEYQPVLSVDKNYSLSDFNTIVRRKERAEHLLEIIRLTAIVTDVPLRKRLEMLADLHSKFKQYSIHELCDAMEVARGTFYNHIFRKADRKEYFREQSALMLQVQQVFDDSKQRFGAEKIRAILAESGVRVSKRRIQSIMRELGLQSVRNNAKRDYKKRQEYQRRNHLSQEFTADRINQAWVSDITYFKIRGYAIYLCVILDLFSRKVIGFRVSRKSSTHLVTSTFKEAFAKRGCPQDLTFHSDRGGQYISDTFDKLLRQCGVRRSFSATNRPYDNAVAETFFATFKKEEAYRRDYSSEQNFRKSVEQYIQFYNEARPHKTLGYKTPMRFEELYGKAQQQ
jgi:transposase InsO family protein/transposase-like protein